MTEKTEQEKAEERVKNSPLLIFTGKGKKEVLDYSKFFKTKEELEKIS